MTEKIVAMRADAPSIRESMKAAHEMMHAGVAFVPVPYFTENQKATAVGLAEAILDQLQEPEE